MGSRTRRLDEVNRQDGNEAAAVVGDQLEALARQGARQMLTEALHEEVESYPQRGRYRRPEDEACFRGYRNGVSPRRLTLVDEYSRACLSIDVARRLTSEDVLERLAWQFVTRGVPAFIRSDNGSEFTAHVVRQWLAKVGVSTLYIEPGSPWENGYVESFIGKLKDELVDREIFYTLTEAKVLIERWRAHYNQVRPHSALGYQAPAPEGIALDPRRATLRSAMASLRPPLGDEKRAAD